MEHPSWPCVSVLTDVFSHPVRNVLDSNVLSFITLVLLRGVDAYEVRVDRLAPKPIIIAVVSVQDADAVLASIGKFSRSVLAPGDVIDVVVDIMVGARPIKEERPNM